MGVAGGPEAGRLGGVHVDERRVAFAGGDLFGQAKDRGLLLERWEGLISSGWFASVPEANSFFFGLQGATDIPGGMLGTAALAGAVSKDR